LELFLEPGSEVLVARSGDEVAQLVDSLDATKAARIGEAARARVLAQHTYAHRVIQLEGVLEGQYAAQSSVEGAVS
jgi:spore maturation protein CgeB